MIGFGKYMSEINSVQQALGRQWAAQESVGWSFCLQGAACVGGERPFWRAKGENCSPLGSDALFGRHTVGWQFSTGLKNRHDRGACFIQWNVDKSLRVTSMKKLWEAMSDLWLLWTEGLCVCVSPSPATPISTFMCWSLILNRMVPGGGTFGR